MNELSTLRDRSKTKFEEREEKRAKRLDERIENYVARTKKYLARKFSVSEDSIKLISCCEDPLKRTYEEKLVAIFSVEDLVFNVSGDDTKPAEMDACQILLVKCEKCKQTYDKQIYDLEALWEAIGATKKCRCSKELKSKKVKSKGKSKGK